MNTRIYCITRDRNDYTAYLDNTATLRTRSGVVAESVRIRLLRKPDAGNSGSKTNHHFVFFIGNCRPWVCPESSFLKE